VQDSPPPPRDLSNSLTGSQPRAYLDTTVVANALLRSDQAGQRCVEAIRRFRIVEMPEYAIKEFKAGPLSAWIWCHNKFNETRSLADTLAAINSISATPRRNFSASARQAFEQATKADQTSFAQVLDLGQQAEPILDRALADRYRYYLRRRITQAWQHRRSIATEVSMPLLCFVEGELETDSGDSLHFERYSCPRNSDCSVLAELSKRADAVRRIWEVLANQQDKAENQKRYQALRHIVRTPKRSFTDSKCRDVGDAVFAIMAPHDAVILTTNIKDHRPLASALGKVAVEP
jgi:hypothetical protein